MSSRGKEKLIHKAKVSQQEIPGDADNSSQPNSFSTNLDKVDETGTNLKEPERSIVDKKRLSDKG